MSSVGEDFPREQRRVRELLDVYRSLGRNGAFGAAALERVLTQAEEAMASGDVVKILFAYELLRGCK